MLAFLRQEMEERHAQIFETVPAESTTSMNISEKFVDILQLLFKVKYMDENTGLDNKRNKLEAIDKRMDVLYRNVKITDVHTKFDDIVALSNAYYNIGLEYVTSTDTDDLNTAVKYFLRCLKLLAEECFDCKTILTSIGAHNGLSFAAEKNAIKYLNFALGHYHYYMKNYTDPIHIPSLVGVKEEESNPRNILNTLHHTTLQQLRCHYLKRCKDMYVFVGYIHDILNIRLTDMVSNKAKFDEKCLDMALTLFDLSRLFLANNYFAEAKSHIAIGDYVIHRFVEDIRSEGKETPLDSNKSYNNALAVSARSWGSYGVSLLRFWIEKFSQNKENLSEIQDRIKLQILIFSEIIKKEHKAIKITETCIVNLADAKSVFINTLRELETAKKYFTPDRDIETNKKITFEILDIYKYFADFKERKDNQMKLHKRRVKCLRF